jgi:hypothetical protein
MVKFSLICGALLLAGVQVPAHAQDANRDVVMAPTDVASVIDRVAKHAGDFKDQFDHEIAHTMDGKPIEERAKHRADDLHDAAKKLRDVFGDKKDKNSPQVRERVDQVLASASEVNRVMADHRLTDRVQREWEMLRGDLNALASVYELTPIR